VHSGKTWWAILCLIREPLLLAPSLFPLSVFPRQCTKSWSIFHKSLILISISINTILLKKYIWLKWRGKRNKMTIKPFTNHSPTFFRP
jgi:hypothetical protein